MMYFEMLHPWVRRQPGGPHPPGIYFHDGMRNTSIVSSQASRIWEETDDGVHYVKDRLSWDREPDLKEFAWVKLRAKPLEDYR